MPRLIDADALMQLCKNEYSHAIHHRQYERSRGWQGAMQLLYDAPTIDPESLRPHGRWNYNHRHRGGFRRYTGLDSMGEQHTITVDERFEVDDPYCSECGKLNESVFLNFCPNCGAKMDKEKKA